MNTTFYIGLLRKTLISQNVIKNFKKKINIQLSSMKYSTSDLKDIDVNNASLKDIDSNIAHKPKKVNRTSHYVIEETLANTVASTVYGAVRNRNCTLIEANPGPGVLTSAFFSSGFRQVVGLESKKEYLSDLEVVQEEQGASHFRYFLFDLLTIWQKELSTARHHVRNRHTELDIVGHVSRLAPSSDKPVCVFATLTSNKEFAFLFYLVREFLLGDGFFSIAPLHWYLFLSEKTYRELKACEGEVESLRFYNKLSICLYTFFSFRALMQVPGSEFSPAFQGKRKTKHMTSSTDHTQRYLVELIPRPDAHKILPPEEIPNFISFLKQLLVNKRIRLIPKLEQLIPGSGVHLLKLGYTMVQSVSDLSPQDMLRLYQVMQTWPEYMDSPMHFYLSGRSEVSLEEEEVTSPHDGRGGDHTHMDPSLDPHIDHHMDPHADSHIDPRTDSSLFEPPER